MSNSVSILTDDIEEDELILQFGKYCDTIVKMVRGSKPQFSIGIYGEWGTGKTTLMKMVEKKLNTFVKKEVFTWDDITKNNGEDNKLKSFLKEYYRVDWIENSQFVKDHSSNTIIVNDENPRKVIDKGSYHNEYDHSLCIKLDDNRRTAILTIDNNFVREFDVKMVKGKANIHLQENEILTIWFNAWRYEREDQFALIALLKTIAYAMGGLPQYREIKKILLRGAVIIGKGVLRSVVEKWIPLVPKESLDELEKNLLPKMELLSQVDKDTIYFDGLHKIEEEMKKTIANNSKNRIVVFIDDLDRCSPKTALEVFESIKVFLGMEGFIYIVGLSVDTISKLINVAYKDSLVKGEHYIRKIIQLPITIPEWNDIDVIKKLVLNLSKRLDEKYSKLVDENKEVIAKAVELNPREVKRFINNFIIAREIFSGNEVKAHELLLVQALKIRWSKFYSYISTDEKFKDEVKKYAEKSEDDRREAITKRKNDKDNPPKGYENKVFDFESDIELWDFLSNNREVIFQIDWKIYRHVVESLKEEKEIIRESAAVSECGEDSEQLRELLRELLKKGQITEFNDNRRRFGFPPLNLQNEYLSGANLIEVNLRGANLSGANLIEADLRGANLSGSDLSGAKLDRAILERANLSGADLSGAIIRGANLRGADLIDANLRGADLRGAKNMPISGENAKIRGAIVD